MSSNIVKAAERQPFFSSADSLSLYIHVPFCAQKCGYCDFYSRSSRKGVDDFLNSIENEIDLWFRSTPELSQKTVTTLFTGGGTPSILTAEEWIRLSSAVSGKFRIDPQAEWSVEVNPESFSAEKADAWFASGVNRISMGVQSLNPDLLRKAGRIHSAERVHAVLSDPALNRFRVSCDTIYGLPGQSVSDVEETLRALTAYPSVKHISAYELTIAENTPFASLPSKLFPDDDGLADYESAVLGMLVEAGFSRYEVSNYAKPGFECRHNQAYWEMKPYLGLGPSAHSFDGDSRFSNYDSLTEYCRSISSGILPHDSNEKISDEMRREEYLFLALRTSAGISLNRFCTLFGEPLFQGDRRLFAEELIKRGDAELCGDRFALTAKGMNLADGAALRLLQA